MLSISSTLLGLLVTAPSLISALPQNRQPTAYGGPNSALYFLENNPAGSKLAAVEVGSNGTLSKSTETATGGNGSIALGADGNPLALDGLLGQGAVAVGDNYVFTVNSGSNTLSMFSIPPNDPTRPTLVGKPADTQGDFPVSVAYSAALKTACVLNGGLRSSVACFKVEASGLTPLDEEPRSLTTYFTSTTPPKGPANTASTLAFDPDSKTLAVTIKGDPATNAQGTILVYPIGQDKVPAATPTPSKLRGLILNYGFVFLDPIRIFLADPTFGGSIVSLASRANTYHASLVSQVNATSLTSSSRAAYSKALNTAYAIDAGSPKFAVVPLEKGQLDGYIQLDATLQGAYDTIVVGKKAFFLGKTASLGVVDLEAKTMVQTFTPEAGTVGERKFWQGLAVWPESREYRD